MARLTRFVIECRDASGALDFTDPQPEKVFGLRAITGITQDEMAKVVFRLCPEVDTRRSINLTGDTIAAWPSFVDPRFRARVKTW